MMDTQVTLKASYPESGWVDAWTGTLEQFLFDNHEGLSYDEIDAVTITILDGKEYQFNHMFRLVPN